MPDVAFYELFDEELTELNKVLPKEVDAVFSQKSLREAPQKTPPAPVVCIRTQSAVPPHWSREIKAVLTRSTGYEHVAAYRRTHAPGLVCGYLPEYCSHAVAEAAVMYCFVLLKKLKRQMDQFLLFDRNGLTGEDVRGRRLFVLGVGRIGSRVVQLARGLGMEVKGFDTKQGVKGLEYLSLEEGLGWADIIVCSLSLNKETRGLLNEEKLRRTKRGIILINVARGEVMPVDALHALCREGHVGGLALDVFEDEGAQAKTFRKTVGQDDDRTRKILDLQDKDNVVFTPHNAFNTRQAVREKARQTSESLRMFFESGRFPWTVPE